MFSTKQILGQIFRPTPVLNSAPTQVPPQPPTRAHNIRAYIGARAKIGVANKTINLEIGVLRGMLTRAKRLHLFADEIKPLPVRHEIGRALSPEEKLRLQRAARNKPDGRMPG